MKKTKKQLSSVDGFIPRQPGDKIGRLHQTNHKNKKEVLNKLSSKPLNSVSNNIERNLGQVDLSRGLERTDIDESLDNIDNFFESPKKLNRKQRRLLKKQNKKPKSIIRRIIKWTILLIVLGLIGFAGYAAYKFISAGNNIFQGNIFGLLQNQPLKQDNNGRSNFLVLGTSEDDPGHEGANLTDSMLIVSVDQNNKNIYMFSVPRDLYVEYGTACVEGYSGKINSYFSCSNNGESASDEQDRLTKTQALVGDIFGIDIQYGLHINQTVIKQAVDAVGGVDVNIEGSNGASGILDRNADWRCNYTCYYVKYDNGAHHLDGVHALYLSMARGDEAPTYGLSRSNFDREINQQKILMALKDKAMSSGVITNLGAVSQLIDALGDNLRTNIKTEEIRTLMKLAGDIKSSDVHSVSLIGGDDSVVTTGNYGGASVVLPSAGVFEYDDLKNFIQKNLTSNPVVREAAPIVVLNGSGQVGFGQSEADKLTDADFNVVLVGNATEGDYDQVEIYQIDDGNDATAKKLTDMFNVIIKKTPPPLTVNGNVRFVIIFGPANI